ncbi:MAG: M23 family metallopeptidase [Elusimicrobiota bacterium]
MRRALQVFTFVAILLAGCSTANQIGREVLRTVPQGRKYGKYLNAWDRYSRIAKTLRKYHDSKHLDEGDILDVLYGSGVLKKRPPVRRGRKTPPRTQPPKSFPVPVYKGAWRWPLEAGVVSSEFGPRWKKMHHGIDIAADQGEPLYASADGEVIYSDNKLRGYGNVVILRHDQQTTSLYAHNKKNEVTIGKKVKRGQIIALLGSTGRSTGPHTHYEIRGSGGAINPRKVLPKSRF